MSNHRRKVADPDIRTALPIVPMLDMTFQLLFFFIITFNPGQREGQMSMNLPATGEAKAKDQSNVAMSPNSDTELEVASDYVVEVKSYEANLTVAVRESEKKYELGSI